MVSATGVRTTLEMCVRIECELMENNPANQMGLTCQSENIYCLLEFESENWGGLVLAFCINSSTSLAIVRGNKA